MITLRLPIPPSNNVYYRHNRGETHISKHGIAYRGTVFGLWLKARKGHVGFTKADRLAVRITLHAPDRRRRDLDNLPKAILDSLQFAGVYPDDSQIDHLYVIRGKMREEGEVLVHVHKATP